MQPIKQLLSDVMALWMPPPSLSVSDWADEYRKLSPESSAEPGQWRTSRAEYQRGILNALNDPAVETIIVMSSAQVGKTEVINNIVGYYIHQDPSPILCLQPTLEMAKTWSKDRLAPMVRDTPALAGKLKDPRSRDGDNTLLHKKFAGGHITMAGANSAASLASRPIRVVLCDEVDRYPVSAGTEGDPVNLAKKRTTTFWNRKIVLTSTPTIKDASRIEAAFDSSDQRRFFVPCPHCEEKQDLKWKNIKWEEGHVFYVCEHCGATIEEKHKISMVANGEWIATAKASATKTAGFHLSELVSPWVSWSEMVDNFLEAKKFPETLKTWINTALGETWEEEGDGVSGDELQDRERVIGVHDSVLFITAGVDVQKDRIECSVIGWGLGEEAWVIDHVVLIGDTQRQDVWEQLSDQLLREFEGKETMRISRMFIDSGHQTQDVYRFSIKYSTRGVFAIKGQSQDGKPVTAKPAKRKRGEVKPVPIGTIAAKDVIYGRLKIAEPGAGYVHFADHLDEEYFKQLTAEQVFTKYVQGTPRRYYKQTRDRNEALDCFVYGYAAMVFLNVTKLEVIAKKREIKLSRRAETTDAPPLTALKRRQPVKRKGGFVNAWK